MFILVFFCERRFYQCVSLLSVLQHFFCRLLACLYVCRECSCATLNCALPHAQFDIFAVSKIFVTYCLKTCRMLSIVLPLDLTTLMRCLPRIHFQWIGCSCSILSARAGCPLPNSSDLIFVIFIVVLEVS